MSTVLKKGAPSRSYPSRQKKLGPAPFASFEDLSDELESPADGSERSEQGSRPIPEPLPEIHEEAEPHHKIVTATTSSGASTQPCSGLQTPTTPRIDVSCASSSTSPSTESSSEKELFPGGLGAAFREEGTEELKSSTEELDLGQVDIDSEEERRQKKLRKEKDSDLFRRSSHPADIFYRRQSEFPTVPESDSLSRKPSAHTLFLDGLLSRPQRHGSFGASDYYGRSGAVSSLSARSSGSLRGRSRSPSPHKMMLETSFCGSKPIPTKSVEAESPPKEEPPLEPVTRITENAQVHKSPGSPISRSPPESERSPLSISPIKTPASRSPEASASPAKSATPRSPIPTSPVKSPTAHVRSPVSPAKSSSAEVKSPTSPVKIPETRAKSPTSPVKIPETRAKIPTSPVKSPTPGPSSLKASPAKGPLVHSQLPPSPMKTPLHRSRSPSPHKMMFETSFCGSKPVPTGSVEIENLPQEVQPQLPKGQTMVVTPVREKKLEIESPISTPVKELESLVKTPTKEVRSLSIKSLTPQPPSPTSGGSSRRPSSGGRRSISPFKMIYETSFCGSRPIPTKSMEGEPPGREADIAALLIKAQVHNSATSPPSQQCKGKSSLPPHSSDHWKPVTPKSTELTPKSSEPTPKSGESSPSVSQSTAKYVGTPKPEKSLKLQNTNIFKFPDPSSAGSSKSKDKAKSKTKANTSTASSSSEIPHLPPPPSKKNPPANSSDEISNEKRAHGDLKVPTEAEFLHDSDNDEGDLPYVPTTLPQERNPPLFFPSRSGSITSDPMIQLQRPKVVKAPNPASINDYIAHASIMTPTEQDVKMKVKLPREDSTSTSAGPRKGSIDWADFAEMGLRSPRDMRRKLKEEGGSHE